MHNPDAVPVGQAQPNALGRARARMARMGNIWLPIGALIVLTIYFTAREPAFLSVFNLNNIVRQVGFLTILAMAGTFPILIGGIDLSVGAVATVAAIIVSNRIDLWGPAGAILIALAVTSAIGFFNGFVSTYFKVPSFLVTLGMLYIADGISQTISGGSTQMFNNATLDKIINYNSIPHVPNGFVLAVVIVIFLSFVAFYTRFGRHLYAVGSNERAAKLAGVRVKGVKLVVFAMAGLLAGLAGIYFTGQMFAGVPLGVDPSMLNSIVAIVLGGTALSGGMGGPHRTLLGAFVMVALTVGMNMTHITPFVQDVVRGIVLIAAVGATMDRRRMGIIK